MPPPPSVTVTIIYPSGIVDPADPLFVPGVINGSGHYVFYMQGAGAGDGLHPDMTYEITEINEVDGTGAFVQDRSAQFIPEPINKLSIPDWPERWLLRLRREAGLPILGQDCFLEVKVRAKNAGAWVSGEVATYFQTVQTYRDERPGARPGQAS
ncbi:MAG: hypothetical protein L0Z62_21295 [Gemmataceae bacterium]|nr:hypothetical protein [Gemmataceae bacterium]